MSMTDKTFVLKQNSAEIRKKIEDEGIPVCICASFEESCWLDFSTRVNNGVHGVGYWGEDVDTHSQEEALARFTIEASNLVVCDSVEEFIKNIKEYYKK